MKCHLRHLILFLVIALLLLLSNNANAETTKEGLMYEITEDGVHITGCDKTIKGELTIPEKIENQPVIAIDIYAFNECINLETINIPNNVKNIGKEAFLICNSLQTINIPSSVIDIGDFAFEYCPVLTEINVNDKNEKFSSVDGVLFNKDKTKILKYPNGKKNVEYSIISSATEIENGAFWNNQYLTNVIIPNGITNIGFYAFATCPNLKRLTIPKNTVNIGDNFFGCNVVRNMGITNIYDDCIMYVYKGSYAEQYAKTNNISFEYINEIQLNRVIVKKINNTNCLTNIDIKNNSVKNIIESQKNALGESYSLKFYRENNEIAEETKVGTGTVVKVMNGDSVEQEYTVILYGDTTGNGNPSAVDALVIVKNKLGLTRFLNEFCEEAGRTTNSTRESNGIPSAIDALLIVKYKLELENINQE